MHLTANATGAVAVFDCGAGRIPIPLRLDSARRFVATGSVTREAGWSSLEFTARYEGALQDTLLTVRVVLEPGEPEGDVELGTFYLRANEAPPLVVCR